MFQQEDWLVEGNLRVYHGDDCDIVIDTITGQARFYSWKYQRAWKTHIGAQPSMIEATRTWVEGILRRLQESSKKTPPNGFWVAYAALPNGAPVWQTGHTKNEAENRLLSLYRIFEPEDISTAFYAQVQ